LAEPALYKKTRKLNLSPVSAAIRGLIAYNNAAEWETINNDARRQTFQTQQYTHACAIEQNTTATTTEHNEKMVAADLSKQLP